MTIDDLITIVLDEAFYVHRRTGPGMLENVYKTCLAYRLQKRGLRIETEKAVPVYFEEVKMECGYRVDILVEGRLVIEIKSIEGIGPLQVAQVLTYLRFLSLRQGIILNFDVPLLRDGIKRVVNGYVDGDEKPESQRSGIT
jgi:GxxExxY protein